MKTDKDKFIELMNSFGVEIEVESYGNPKEFRVKVIDEYDIVDFIFNSEEKYDYMNVVEY